MIQRTIAIASIVTSSFISLPALAQNTQSELLFDALGLPDIVDIMREEGVVYGAQIGTDLFPNQVSPAWRAQSKRFMIVRRCMRPLRRRLSMRWTIKMSPRWSPSLALT